MKRLKELALMFAWVTTGVLMASTIFIGIFYGYENASFNILWQIIVCALICTIGSLIYPNNREISRRQALILTGIYYVYINIVVLGCGLAFQWFNVSHLGMVIMMLILIAVVFIVIWRISLYRAKKLADEMNKRLEAYQKSNK